MLSPFPPSRRWSRRRSKRVRLRSLDAELAYSRNRRTFSPPAFAVDGLLQLLRKDVLAARIAMLPFGVRNNHRLASDVRRQGHAIIAALLQQAQLAANRALFGFHLLFLNDPDGRKSATCMRLAFPDRQQQL